MPEMPSILKKILDTKAEEVAHRQSRLKLDETRARAADLPPARGFADRVQAVADYGPAGRAEGVEAIKSTCRHALQPLTAAQHINTNHWAIINGNVARAG